MTCCPASPLKTALLLILWVGEALINSARRVLSTFLGCGDGKLTAWLRWAARSRLASFVKLVKTIRRHLNEIHNMLDCGLSNARIEANNTHMRVLTRQGYGYRSANALITMAMLKRSGLCPPLPGRT